MVDNKVHSKDLTVENSLISELSQSGCSLLCQHKCRLNIGSISSYATSAMFSLLHQEGLEERTRLDLIIFLTVS
jgi:hypothetical protein